MGFQKKIIIIYMIFSVLIIGMFGCALFAVDVARYKEKEYSRMQSISNVKMAQMKGEMSGMASVITYLLSDMEVLDALREFKTLDAETYEELYYDDAVEAIRSRLNTYYLVNEYYRIIIFNKKGNVISNADYGTRRLRQDASYADYPWIDRVSNTRGRNQIIGLHKDNWGQNEDQEVISLVKEVQGDELGYIEIQQSKEKLNNLFEDNEENISYIFATDDGQVIYTNAPELDAGNLLEQMTDKRESQVEDGKRAYLCMKQESEEEDVILLTLSDTDIVAATAKEITPLLLCILAGMLAISSGYVYFTSRQLTRPIKRLQQYMKDTHIDTMDAEIPEKIENDEIEALYITFKDLMKRLNKSMVNEKRMALLQTQAQFDMLQTQVDPHFIYNVLNVISGRGMMLNDEVICNICAELAGMLRYSTDTKNRHAVVGDEIQYVDRYMHLLKYRYEEKLSYRIKVDEKIYEQVVPKIILQQIVENSIVHGYGQIDEQIRVEITGTDNENGWYLSVRDYGCGIGTAKVNELCDDFRNISKKLREGSGNMELAIGGMGLRNVYARLYLMFGERLVFKIVPLQEGTIVTIGAKRDDDNV